MDRYKENKAGTRKQFLEMAAEIPGIYVPAFMMTYMIGTMNVFCRIMNMPCRWLPNKW